MKGNHRFAELDALRGIAALTVVGYHYTTRYDQVYGHTAPIGFHLAWGLYGVNLFFAISGFVIFMTLERSNRPFDFIVSRFSRLYPAYWAAMCLTVLVVTLGAIPDLQVSRWQFIANLTMLQGWMRIEPVDGAYWTLNVELGFYLAMLTLFATGLAKQIVPVLLGWISLKWVWWLIPLPNIIGLILVERYIPFFAIGICAYGLFTGRIAPKWAATLIGFAIITEFAIDGPDLGLVSLLVTAIFIGFISGKLRILTARVLTLLGAISYTLYLLHEHIGWTIIHRAEASGVTPWMAILLAFGSALFLASVVTVLIERPAMKWIRRVYREHTTGRLWIAAGSHREPSSSVTAREGNP